VGITAARAAGMASVALVGTVAADRLGEADLVVRSLRELLDVSRLAALLDRAP
jgi:beta-phosphoglucomutase-like phosphatase (HAD superfamily)